MRARRPLRIASSFAVGLALAGLVACGGDDDDGSGGGDPDGFAYEAARLCSDVISDADHDVARAGTDASLAVVELAVRGEGIDTESATRYAEQIDAYREELVGARDRLASIEPDDDADRAAWDEVVASLDAPIELLELRSGLLREVGNGDGLLDHDLIDVGGGRADQAALGAAIAQLGLTGRDCETLSGQFGAPSEHAEFVDAASSTCTTIVSRRRAAGFSTDHTLEAVQQAHAGAEVVVTPELVAEVEAVADEWNRTFDDLGAIPTDGVPDAALWQDVLDAAAERGDGFERRGAALEAGDQAQIVEVFTPGNLYTHPGLGDLTALGLDGRDCRSVEP